VIPSSGAIRLDAEPPPTLAQFARPAIELEVADPEDGGDGHPDSSQTLNRECAGKRKSTSRGIDAAELSSTLVGNVQEGMP